MKTNSKEKRNNFLDVFKNYQFTKVSYNGLKLNIRFVYFKNTNKYAVTIYMTDETIKNKMKGEIIQ